MWDRKASGVFFFADDGLRSRITMRRVLSFDMPSEHARSGQATMHLDEKTRGYRGFVEFWTTDTDASGTGESQSGMLLFGRVLFRTQVLVAFTQDAVTVLSIFCSGLCLLVKWRVFRLTLFESGICLQQLDRSQMRPFASLAPLF